MLMPTVKRMSWVPAKLTIVWADEVHSDYAAPWLRDNLLKDRDPHSGQRLIDIIDLPADPVIRSAAVEGDRLLLQFDDGNAAAAIDLDWLATWRETPPVVPERRRVEWLDGTACSIPADFARLSFADFASHDDRRLAWLTRLLQRGLAFLSELPATDAAILEAMSLVGQVASTNYGLVFDVRSVADPENLAYSDLGLGLHTDNPYREPVPGFQALHAVISSPDGGDSLFADGFALANHLKQVDAQSFAVLCRTPVPFLYRSQNAELYAERPLIQLDCRGDIAAVHYNSRSISTVHGRGLDGFYAAYRRFAGLLREPRHQFKVRLRDGDLAVFDNQRVLHGRTAFSSARHPRHLRGCYLTRDSVYSQAALLRRRQA